MRALTIGSLFSGIGGLELGLEHATGGRVVFQVERDAWCRDVLAKHWPDAFRYDDVCTVRGLPRVDIICGGFPCQDVSVAGKRAGFAGERSSLWREYRRIVADVGPRFVFVENVPGLLTADDGWAFGEVLGDLAALGFDATWDVFRASDVGAPHRRERLFLLAHAHRGGRGGGTWELGASGSAEHSDGGAAVADPGSEGLEGQRRLHGEDASGSQREGRPAPTRCGGTALAGVGAVPHGLSRGLDSHRWPAGPDELQRPGEPARTLRVVEDRRAQLTAYGNAVVPQVAALAWRVLYARAVRAVMEAA